MPTQIQGIEFEVVGNASNAAESLDKLAASLSKIKRVTSGGLGLSGLGKDMKALSNAMKGFNAGKLESFGKAMSGMASAVRTLAKGSEGMRLAQLVLEDIAKIDFTNLQKAGEAAKNIAAVTRLIAGISEGGKQAAMSSPKMALFSAALGKVGNGALKAGKSLLSMPFKNVADRVKSLNGRMTTLLSSLKRIAFYRFIRSIIKEVGQAIKEGVQNLYNWSRVADGTFAASMDRISTSMNYFKNSIGAAVAPIINALAPAIDFIVDKIVALINLINQLFALLSGATFWTRAKKKATEYGDAVGGAGAAAKEALRYLAPFDELNVLPDDRDGGGGGGGGADYSDMFERVDAFNENIKDFVDKLKEAFNNADWKTLGSLLGNKVNELVDRVPFADLGKKIGFYINAWFSTKYWTLETINFRKLGRKIAEFLNNMLGEIDFDIVGRTITQPFTMLGDFIIGALYNIDWHLVGSSLHDFIIGAFSQISEWLDEIDWTEFGEKLMTAIINFIEGLDPIEVIGKLAEFLAKVVNAVGEMLSSMIATLWNDVVEKHPWLETLGLGKVNANQTQIIDDLGQTWVYDKKTGKLELDVTASATSIKNNLPKGQKGALQNVTANVDTMTDYGLDKTIDNTIARLIRWEKANSFDSTVSDMVSEFAQWAKSNGYSSVVNDMVSGFSSWVKSSGYSSTITGMVSSFTSYLKANGYPTTVTDMIVSFVKWAKQSGFSSTVTDMLANFKSWSKANGFDNTITGFKAALSSYLQQFDDPAIKAIAAIWDMVDWTDGNTVLSTIAAIREAYPELANDPVLDAIADFVEYWNIPEQIITPGVIDYDADYYGSYVAAQNERAKRDNDKLAVHYSALGGVFSHGFWSSIPQFASGGALHGSLFLAGESGAELVGHVGGRTEVLNRSQLAATMYASVNNAMRGMTQESDVSEDAMYRAFRRALDETDFGGDVELDGEVMYRSMVRRNNQNTRMTGVNAFA